MACTNLGTINRVKEVLGITNELVKDLKGNLKELAKRP
jgi:hypothetical protein